PGLREGATTHPAPPHDPPPPPPARPPPPPPPPPHPPPKFFEAEDAIRDICFSLVGSELCISESGTDARIDRSRLLGQPVTVTIPTLSLLTPRFINGKVTRVAVSAVELTGTRYAVYQL
ncbi:hypothetical protein ACVGWI_12465, partial [Enterobacter hormaechei]